MVTRQSYAEAQNGNGEPRPYVLFLRVLEDELARVRDGVGEVAALAAFIFSLMRSARRLRPLLISFRRILNSISFGAGSIVAGPPPRAVQYIRWPRRESN